MAEVLGIQRLLGVAGSLLLAAHLVITVLAHTLCIKRTLRVGTLSDFILHSLALEVEVLCPRPRATLDTRLDGINNFLGFSSERLPVDFGLRHVDQLLIDGDIRVRLIIETIHGDRVHLVLLNQLNHLSCGLSFFLHMQRSEQSLGMVVPVLILIILGFNLLTLENLILEQLH